MTCDCGSPARYGHRCGPCHRAAVPLDERLRMAAEVAPAPVVAAPALVPAPKPRPVAPTAPVPVPKPARGSRLRKSRVAVCVRCNRERPIKGRGLCPSCHNYCHKRGLLDTLGLPPLPTYPRASGEVIAEGLRRGGASTEIAS